MSAPVRSVLRWYGGKWQLAEWIASHFGPHDGYTEAFGGAASVLLRKVPAKVETWNDREGRLVNFFRMLREREAELVRAIALTPYARQEYRLAHEISTDPLEDARRFYVLCQQGRTGSGARAHRSGWRYERADNRNSGPVADEFASVGHLRAVAARFKHVQIEHDDALAVLARYDAVTTLHFVDPPYVQSSRGGWDRYVHDLTDDGHRELAEVLRGLEGMVVLSGYPSALYTTLFAGWVHADRQAVTDKGWSTERLWLNPAAAAAQCQPSLFAREAPA